VSHHVAALQGVNQQRVSEVINGVLVSRRRHLINSASISQPELSLVGCKCSTRRIV
jgi:hypothetical protein